MRISLEIETVEMGSAAIGKCKSTGISAVEIALVGTVAKAAALIRWMFAEETFADIRSEEVAKTSTSSPLTVPFGNLKQTFVPFPASLSTSILHTANSLLIFDTCL